MLTIIRENDREMTYSSTGFNLYIDGRKKYFGRLNDALKRFGWGAAAVFLHGEEEIALKEHLKQTYPEKVRVRWSMEGIAGPYECETVPHHRGTALTLTSFTDSHLAKSPTTTSSCFPATHAQAAMKMLIMDVESKAFRDGPFSSEEEMLGFMKERFSAIKKAAEVFTPIDGKDLSESEDEDNESEESNNSDEAA